MPDNENSISKNEVRDPSHLRIVKGLAASSTAAVERARATQTRLVIWRNNRVEIVSPDEISQLLETIGEHR